MASRGSRRNWAGGVAARSRVVRTGSYAPNRHDTGSTTARSGDEIALIRDTINHYGPVFIAPLSIRIRRAGVQKKFGGRADRATPVRFGSLSSAFSRTQARGRGVATPSAATWGGRNMATAARRTRRCHHSGASQRARFPLRSLCGAAATDLRVTQTRTTRRFTPSTGTEVSFVRF